MSKDSEHRHDVPPGYLGDPPEPADPHDHHCSMPIIPERVNHDRAHAKRWHEIATEGLPPDEAKGLPFWVYGAALGARPILVKYAARGHNVSPWDVLIGDDFSLMDENGDDAQCVTHWMPCEEYAPPTKEPR